MASNHRSYLDPVILGVVCQRKLNFMAKQELFCNPLFSWLISRLGAFPIKRDSPDLSALKEAIERLKKGKALIIFPEGSRQMNAGAYQPQAGIGFLAKKLDVPIIPCFVRGTDFALPKGAKFLRPANIYVYFGKQVSLERGLSHQEIAQSIMEDINSLAENFNV